MASSLKLPPQNVEAEESVLGALMIDKNAIIKVSDLLKPEDFYKSAHGNIYDEILRLYEQNQPVDILSVTSRLKENNRLEAIGGSSYLSKLINSVPTASHIDHYAKIVKDKKILRDLISASSEITEKAFEPNDNIDEILDEIEQRIFSISQSSQSQRFINIKEELKGAYERIEKLHSGGGAFRGIPTGFAQLDNILSGLQNSDLVIVGARPSLGKTSFVLDIARYVAIKKKHPIGIFSLEMSKEQIIDRLIAAEAEIPLWKLRTGRLSSDTDFELIQSALDTLSQASIFVEDAPFLNILQMRSMARRLQMDQGLSLLIIDYLQLLQPRRNSDNMVQQITEISRGLKGLARELNIPVIAVSQLSRAVDQREIRIPRLADLRESGSIEQDADVVLFIYRKDRDKSSVAPEEENIAEIIISKHRNGPLGTARLRFDPEKASFKNIDTYHQGPA